MLRVPPRTAAAADPEPPGTVVPPVDPLHAASPRLMAPMAATHGSALLFRVMRSLFRDGHECRFGGRHRRRRFHARHACHTATAAFRSRHGSATGPSRSPPEGDGLVTVVMEGLGS